MSQYLKFKEAIRKVLKDKGGPMTAAEIWQCIHKQRLVQTRGATPARTVYSVLFNDIGQYGNQSQFMHAGDGRFKIKSSSRLMTAKPIQLGSGCTRTVGKIDAKGPYPIEELGDRVTKHCAGAYLFSRAGRRIDYVGRSDSRLPVRMKQSNREGDGYRWFWFKYVTSRMQAYRQECLWWHKYEPADNSNHPQVPCGCSWRCPVSDCERGPVKCWY